VCSRQHQVLVVAYVIPSRDASGGAEVAAYQKEVLHVMQYEIHVKDGKEDDMQAGGFMILG
jgi:hypothetical protein